MQNVTRMGAFCSFFEESLGKFYKSWLKSNRFQSFRLVLPIVNITVEYFSRNIEISQ